MSFVIFFSCTKKPKKIEQRTLDVSMEKKIGGEVSFIIMLRMYFSFFFFLQKRKITSRCGEIDQEVNFVHLGFIIINNGLIIITHNLDDNSSWSIKGYFEQCYILPSRG